MEALKNWVYNKLDKQEEFVSSNTGNFWLFFILFYLLLFILFFELGKIFKSAVDK